MATQSIDGVRIHYRWDGPADGPVVVMSHSLACASAMWDPQMAALTARYRVLRFDTRGHGGSEAPDGPYSVDELAEDARGLIRALDLGPVHFVGLSLGGMIGMALAVGHPGLVRSLVVCDSMCETNDANRAAVDGRIRIAESEGMSALVRPTLERWFTPAYIARRPPALAAVEQMIRATPVAGYVGCCNALKTLDLKDRIRTITAPTLVVVGEDDPATPPAAAEVIRGQIHDSALVVLPEASHLSNVEQAGAFNAALVAFLARHDGP